MRINEAHTHTHTHTHTHAHACTHARCVRSLTLVLKVYHDEGIKDTVTFKLSPGIRGPEHTHSGYSCVDETGCDAETYFLCAQTLGASVDFLACMDASSSPAATSAKTCASSNKPALDWGKLSTCFSGDQGTSLKKAAALYFDKLFPQPVGVPHIEINGEAFSGDRTEAGLVQALCATGIKAGACRKGTVNATDALSYI